MVDKPNKETDSLAYRQWERDEHRRQINFGKLRGTTERFLERVNPVGGITFTLEQRGKVTAHIFNPADRAVYGKVFREKVEIYRQPLLRRARADRVMGCVLHLGPKGLTKKAQGIFYGEIKEEK